MICALGVVVYSSILFEKQSKSRDYDSDIYLSEIRYLCDRLAVQINRQQIKAITSVMAF